MTSLILFILGVGEVGAWLTKHYLQRWVIGAAILLTIITEAILTPDTTAPGRAGAALVITAWVFMLAGWLDASGMACLRGHEWVTTARLPNGSIVSFASNNLVMVHRLMAAAMVPTDSPKVRVCERCGVTDESRVAR